MKGGVPEGGLWEGWQAPRRSAAARARQASLRPRQIRPGGGGNAASGLPGRQRPFRGAGRGCVEVYARLVRQKVSFGSPPRGAAVAGGGPCRHVTKRQRQRKCSGGSGRVEPGARFGSGQAKNEACERGLASYRS